MNHTTKRITPQAVRRNLHLHHYFINSHYISNIIVIRNNQPKPAPFPDTLIIFCDEVLKSTWQRYNVSSSRIIKEGQYINAFKLGKIDHHDALIQESHITIISADNNQSEQTGLFNIIICNPNHCKNENNPLLAIQFQDPSECHEFFAYCKVASSFNGGVFSLTLINLSDI